LHPFDALLRKAFVSSLDEGSYSLGYHWVWRVVGHHYRKTVSTHQFFIFIGTDKYIQITFIGFRTNEYRVVFISLGPALTNIWVVCFDFDRPHIFFSDMTYIRRLTDEYMWRRADRYGPQPMNIGGIWKPGVSFLSLPHTLHFICPPILQIAPLYSLLAPPPPPPLC
jgi:hypothetical protein